MEMRLNVIGGVSPQDRFEETHEEVAYTSTHIRIYAA
jgi:hypothetical protein